MKVLDIILIITLLVLLFSRTEKFQEFFGFAGYKKPISVVKIDETYFDTTGYELVKTVLNNDEMGAIVEATNKAVKDATGLCTYVIETNEVQKLQKNDKDVIYKCKFTLTTTKGFVFGFAVHVIYKNGEIVSLATQPFGYTGANNIEAFKPDKVEENYEQIANLNDVDEAKFKNFIINYEKL